MVLYMHDQNYYIKVNGQELMNSRQYESELELARLGCAHLKDKKTACVLIGGLGIGFTLRQALEILPSNARVVVSELMEIVVDWNREYFGELSGYAINNPRVELVIGDAINLIRESTDKFDAIIMDIDNGPGAVTDSGNSRLYSRRGILSCMDAMKKNGCIAFWSAEPDKEFEQRLVSCGLHVLRYRATAYKSSKARSRFIWVASKNKDILPPGGGEPRKPERREPSGDQKWQRIRRRKKEGY